MIGAGEVCGCTRVQPPTSIVTHVFTGTFEVYDVTRRTETNCSVSTASSRSDSQASSPSIPEPLARARFPLAARPTGAGGRIRFAASTSSSLVTTLFTTPRCASPRVMRMFFAGKMLHELLHVGLLEPAR